MSAALECSAPCEKEAEAEGPEAVAQLSAFKQRFAVGLPGLGGKTAAVRSLERNTIQSIHLSPSGNLTILYQDGSTRTIGDQTFWIRFSGESDS